MEQRIGRPAARGRRPDFFIVGAPKCGTTALTYYLGQHPSLHLRARKDVPFFGSDLHASRPRESEFEYVESFVAGEHSARIGDSCVWYLCSDRAPGEIKAFSPDAKIIVMVRNPVAMAHALHSQLVFTADEDIVDFAAALAAQDRRSKGVDVPRASGFRVDEALQYCAQARFGAHLARYLDVFGNDHVHVIVLEEFAADVDQGVKDTFRFLGVDSNRSVDGRPVNRNKVARSARLQYFLRHPPDSWVRLAHTATPTRFHGRIIPFLKRLNSKHAAREPMDPAVKAALVEEFKDDVKYLERLLGRPIAAWRDFHSDADQ